MQKIKTVIFIAGLLVFCAQSVFSSAAITLKKSPSYKTISAKVISTISLPRSYHEGLYPDGANLWVSNGDKGKIWVIDTASGKVISTIEPPAGFTESVSKLPGGQLLISDWDEKKLYKASLQDGRLVPESWVSVSPAHPAGAVWAGDKLFVIAWTRGLGTRFDLLMLDEKMKLSRTVSIQEIEEPSQLAWDGSYLWISSWYDQFVYKVDIKKWEIFGSFRSPVPKATGIAWDGKYLWLTGTYSDLYKIEIAEKGKNMKLTVTSGAFKDGGAIPSKYTCDGEDVSPDIAWSGVPASAKSIAMIADDPDAPRGTWVHWVIYNIPPETKGLGEGVERDKVLDNGAMQGMNDSRQTGYGGPCPPAGVHRYFFKVYALDAKLSLGPGATKKDLEDAMKGHILADGQLMGRYSRS